MGIISCNHARFCTVGSVHCVTDASASRYNLAVNTSEEDGVAPPKNPKTWLKVVASSEAEHLRREAEEEMGMLDQQGMWEATYLPEGRATISCKGVF